MLRAVLVVAGVGQVWMATPGLLHGEGHGLTHHAARHMGSLGLAMAFAFVLVAWRPRRALSMAPLVGVLSLSLVVMSAFDLVMGRTMMIVEFAHVPEVSGSIAIACLASAERRRAVRTLAL